MSILPTATRQQAAYRLAAVGAFGGFGVAVSLTYRLTGLGLPCPWRLVTGTLCPFCGATHMGVHLLSLDLPAAWSDNAFVLVSSIGLALASVLWIVEAFGGPSIRWPQFLRDSRVWWGSIAITGLVFTVVRNL